MVLLRMGQGLILGSVRPVKHTPGDTAGGCRVVLVRMPLLRDQGCPVRPSVPQAMRGLAAMKRFGYSVAAVASPSPVSRPFLTLTTLLLPPCRPRVPLQV